MRRRFRGYPLSIISDNEINGEEISPMLVFKYCERFRYIPINNPSNSSNCDKKGSATNEYRHSR